MKNKIKMNKWTGGTVLAGLSLISLSAVAQDAESLDNGVGAPPPETKAGETASLPVTASAGASYQFQSDINRNNGVEGKFSLTRTHVGLVVPVRLNDQFTLTTTARYEYDYYDFSDMSPAGTDDPWKNINILSGSSTLNYKIDDKWSVYGGGFLKVAAEAGSDLGQGVTGGGLAGVNYKINDDLTIGGGLAIFNQIEEQTLYLPLITAKWKFADDWMLNVGLTDVSTMGYGASVKWLFDKDWDFTFGIQAHKTRFRIMGDAATGTKDGVGQESSSLVFADACYHVNDKFDVDGFVGIAAGGKLRLDNSSGDKQFDSRYDAAPVIGAKASLRF